MLLAVVIRRIGGLEIEVSREKLGCWSYPPDRRLRNTPSAHSYYSECYPPDRRLRKTENSNSETRGCYPPDRRLRKMS